MAKSLAEVLAEMGFEVVLPQELTYQTPLNEIEGKVVAEYDYSGSGIPSLDEMLVSEALSTLQSFCGVDRSELESLIFKD